MDESSVVVSEYFNDQSERCYGKRFDLIADFKRYRLAPQSPLRAMFFVGMWSENSSPSNQNLPWLVFYWNPN